MPNRPLWRTAMASDCHFFLHPSLFVFLSPPTRMNGTAARRITWKTKRSSHEKGLRLPKSTPKIFLFSSLARQMSHLRPLQLMNMEGEAGYVHCGVSDVLCNPSASPSSLFSLHTSFCFFFSASRSHRGTEIGVRWWSLSSPLQGSMRSHLSAA